MRAASGPKVEAYWRAACEAKGIDEGNRHWAYTFADPEMGAGELIEELVELARAGKKRGTCHLLRDFERNGIPMREAGDYWIVMDAAGEPACVVRITAVEVKPYGEVDAEFAASEGEGDLSLEYWRRAHAGYFDAQCARWGEEWGDDSPVVCESFEFVYP